MNKFIETIDLKFSYFIRSISITKNINNVLSKVNRGETVAVIFFPLAFYLQGWKLALFSLLFSAIITYCNDRLVLWVKKTTSRKRPLIRVLEKQDSNPDMKHSFPSAHAANSMVFLCILSMAFGYSSYIIVLSFLAGIGRLITLHHFLSDVIAGWLIGFLMSLLAVYGILPILVFFDCRPA